MRQDFFLIKVSVYPSKTTRSYIASLLAVVSAPRIHIYAHTYKAQDAFYIYSSSDLVYCEIPSRHRLKHFLHYLAWVLLLTLPPLPKWYFSSSI